MSKDSKQASERSKRLAEALRANLRRRKEAARARNEAGQEAGADNADSITEVTSGESGDTRVPK